MNIEELKSHVELERMTLGLTKLACEVYFILPHQETKKLVEACAVDDWGFHTACMFEPKKITVENLDGRIEVIHASREQ